MSTLDGVSIDVDDDFGTVTASWADPETGEGAGLTVSRALLDGHDLKNVVTGLIDDMEREVEGE